MINDQNLKTITVTSQAFNDFGPIPVQYTCQGENYNPPISFGNVPKNTRSLALIVDDPDAPRKTWVHWVVWNIPVAQQIDERSVPGVQGLNDFGKNDYGGPCPPSGRHRYFFKVYALDTTLSLHEGATKAELEQAMHHHILGWGELVGLYKRF